MSYNKYRVSPRHKRTAYGITFDSMHEMERFLILKDRENKKEITGLKLQVCFILQDAFVYAGNKQQPIKYIVDFVYFDWKLGVDVYEDAKGMKTEVYRIKRKLFLKQNPQIVFIET